MEGLSAACLGVLCSASADMRGDVQYVFQRTPVQKQVMMFSATMSEDVKNLAKKFMAKVSPQGDPPPPPLQVGHAHRAAAQAGAPHRAGCTSRPAGLHRCWGSCSDGPLAVAPTLPSISVSA